MVATVFIHSFHGPFPSPIDITNTTIRFKRADNDNVDGTNPLVITPTNTTYSYRKNTRIYITAGPANQIDNLKWYLDETSNGGATYAASGFHHYSGLDPVYNQGVAGDVNGVVPGLVDTELNYISTTPLTVFAGTFFTSSDGVPAYEGGAGTQDYVVQQMAVTPTAGAGVSPTRSFIYAYDES